MHHLKTRPGQFKLPVKRGLQDCFHITHENAHDWCLPQLWSVESQLFGGLDDTPAQQARKAKLERVARAFRASPTRQRHAVAELLGLAIDALLQGQRGADAQQEHVGVRLSAKLPQPGLYPSGDVNGAV